MPANPGTTNKATSPSKAIQQNVTNNWGKNQGTTDPKQAIRESYNKNPVSVPGGKK